MICGFSVAEIARAFLADQSGPEQVRHAMALESGFDPAVWKQVGAELGWASVSVPEATAGSVSATWSSSV